MKVAYLLGSLNRGGTETLLLDVFRNARQNALDAVCIYRKTGVLEPEFLKSGVQMHRIAFSRNIAGYLLRLRKALIREKAEIIHAQQPIDALYAYWACKGLKKKIDLTFHGYDYTDGKVGQAILRYIIRRTDGNIYVSNTQREYYLQKYGLDPQKQRVVYNGISFDKLDTFDTRSAALSRAPGNKQSLRNELKLSRETLLLGAVGNFNEVRDQFTLCKFLKLLHEKQVDFHFVFVGKRVEGQEQLYDRCMGYCLENGLEKNVSFLGVRNDVPQILSQLDAFVYSTNHDTFGIAVVEAMAMGIPVFVNDWGVMQEITDNGKYATLYKTRDENDLLQEFMLFLHDKSQYNENAKNASRFVREHYSIEKHIQKLIIVYSSE
jgi:glycosyltransferase involved in cell wall biosynthesis